MIMATAAVTVVIIIDHVTWGVVGGIGDGVAISVVDSSFGTTDV